MRRHLTIVVGEATVPEVAAARHRWDPVMAAGVPPHASVIYPEDHDDLDALLTRARAVCPATPPFVLTLGAVTADADGAGGVFVALDDPTGGWSRLRRALLPAAGALHGIGPHLTIVHPRTSSRGPEAWRALSGTTFMGAIDVREIALTETSVEDGMRTVERFALAAP